MSKKTKIIAILGKSGSGKSTIADILKKHGIPPVTSHTTRPKRDENDTHHVFVTEGAFNMIEGKIAKTVYGGYKYCGVIIGNKPCYSYVIDEVGLKTLMADPRFEVTKVLVLAPTEERKQRTTPERFDRDKDYKYGCMFDNVILNHRDMAHLEGQIQTIIKKVCEDY